ncbi:MAG: hypothetical protein GWP08_09700 [Nitrospiraceae bacterium]|nr:hypothetical protein [Nitrospiraceae bacterium]
MITPREAWAILVREVTPLEPSRICLSQAAGGYLAEPVLADRDIPPADRSAMDGYALRAAELPARLLVDGEVAAGSAASPSIPAGHCVRIYTGANIPSDVDTVVPVERTSTRSFADGSDDGWVEIAEREQAGANTFGRGENARSGQRLLNVGTRLGPSQVGVAAATGYGDVLMYRRPRIRILTTGAELLEPHDSAAAHQVRDSNGPMLLAALGEAGFADVTRAVVIDDLEATLGAVREGLAETDAVILTGGISAGRHDYVPQALLEAGAEILYRGIAMKPGKPQLFAKTRQGQYLFGLPGNPLSAIVGLHELVLPGLRRLSGCPAERCRPTLNLPLAGPVRNARDRLLVIPAVLDHGHGGTCVRLRPPVGSADLVTGGTADGAILVPPNTSELPVGTIVPFRSWGGTAT